VAGKGGVTASEGGGGEAAELSAAAIVAAAVGKTPKSEKTESGHELVLLDDDDTKPAEEEGGEDDGGLMEALRAAYNAASSFDDGPSLGDSIERCYKIVASGTGMFAVSMSRAVEALNSINIQYNVINQNLARQFAKASDDHYKPHVEYSVVMKRNQFGLGFQLGSREAQVYLPAREGEERNRAPLLAEYAGHADPDAADESIDPSIVELRSNTPASPTMQLYQEVMVQILAHVDELASDKQTMTLEQRAAASRDPAVFRKVAEHLARWRQASLEQVQSDISCKNFEKMLHYCCKHPRVAQFWKEEQQRKVEVSQGQDAEGGEAVSAASVTMAAAVAGTKEEALEGVKEGVKEGAKKEVKEEVKQEVKQEVKASEAAAAPKGEQEGATVAKVEGNASGDAVSGGATSGDSSGAEAVAARASSPSHVTDGDASTDAMQVEEGQAEPKKEAGEGGGEDGKGSAGVVVAGADAGASAVVEGEGSAAIDPNRWSRTVMEIFIEKVFFHQDGSCPAREGKVKLLNKGKEAEDAEAESAAKAAEASATGAAGAAVVVHDTNTADAVVPQVEEGHLLWAINGNRVSATQDIRPGSEQLRVVFQYLCQVPIGAPVTFTFRYCPADQRELLVAKARELAELQKREEEERVRLEDQRQRELVLQQELIRKQAEEQRKLLEERERQLQVQRQQWELSRQQQEREFVEQQQRQQHLEQARAQQQQQKHQRQQQRYYQDSTSSTGAALEQLQQAIASGQLGAAEEAQLMHLLQNQFGGQAQTEGEAGDLLNELATLRRRQEQQAQAQQQEQQAQQEQQEQQQHDFGAHTGGAGARGNAYIQQMLSQQGGQVEQQRLMQQMHQQVQQEQLQLQQQQQQEQLQQQLQQRQGASAVEVVDGSTGSARAQPTEEAAALQSRLQAQLQQLRTGMGNVASGLESREATANEVTVRQQQQLELQLLQQQQHQQLHQQQAQQQAQAQQAQQQQAQRQKMQDAELNQLLEQQAAAADLTTEQLQQLVLQFQHDPHKLHEALQHLQAAARERRQQQAQAAQLQQQQQAQAQQQAQQAHQAQQQAQQAQQAEQAKQAEQPAEDASGLSWDSEKKMWHAQLMFDGNLHSLGHYIDKGQAAAVHEDALSKIAQAQQQVQQTSALQVQEQEQEQQAAQAQQAQQQQEQPQQEQQAQEQEQAKQQEQEG
jgi:hypothetical protein